MSEILVSFEDRPRKGDTLDFQRTRWVVADVEGDHLRLIASWGLTDTRTSDVHINHLIGQAVIVKCCEDAMQDIKQGDFVSGPGIANHGRVESITPNGAVIKHGRQWAERLVVPPENLHQYNVIEPLGGFVDTAPNTDEQSTDLYDLAPGVL